MKQLITLLAIVLWGTCNGQSALEATSQDWVAGRCCDRGTNYDIAIHFENPVANVSFEKIWVNGRGWGIGTLTPDTTKATRYFIHSNYIQNNELLDAQEIDHDDNSSAFIHKIDPVCDCEAMRYLLVDGKKVTIEVPSFRVLSPEKRP